MVHETCPEVIGASHTPTLDPVKNPKPRMVIDLVREVPETRALLILPSTFPQPQGKANSAEPGTVTSLVEELRVPGLVAPVHIL